MLYKQSASSLKVIQKSTSVLSRSAPIRGGERPVWASSLLNSNKQRNGCRQEGHFVFELVQNCCLLLAANTTWTTENSEGE